MMRIQPRRWCPTCHHAEWRTGEVRQGLDCEGKTHEKMKKQSSYFEEAVENISNYHAEEDKLSEY